MVCGLLAAAAAVTGLDAYLTIKQLHELNEPLTSKGIGSSIVMAEGLRNIITESTPLAAFAGIVYLLAPPADEPATRESQDAAPEPSTVA